jgi:hypothetical protein
MGKLPLFERNCIFNLSATIAQVRQGQARKNIFSNLFLALIFGFIFFSRKRWKMLSVATMRLKLIFL